MDMNSALQQAQGKIILIWAVVFGAAFLIMPIMIRRAQLKESGKWIEHQKQKAHNKFLRYKSNIFTRARFRIIEQQYLALACYDRATLEWKTVETFEQAVIFSIGIPVVFGILMQDIIMFLMCLLVGYIYYDISINKQYDKLNKKIHEELTICLQSLRDKYKEYNNITKALSECDRVTMLEQPINEIQEILLAPDGEDRLDRFCANSPVRLLKTIAMVCYVVNETGDKVYEDKDSAFSEDLITLRQEADATVRNLENIRIAFKSLPFVSLIGLMILPAIEWYLLNQIPGTSTIIKGTYGILIKLIIVLATVAVYYVISVSMRPSVVNTADRGKFIDNMLHYRVFKQIVKNVIPKQQVAIDKIENKIKSALSQKDIYYIYASKVLYSAGAFVAGLLFGIIFIITTRNYMETNYKSMSITAGVELEEEQFEQLKKMDAEYLKYDDPLGDEALLEFVQSKIAGLNQYQELTQRDRLKQKYAIVKSLHWNAWWAIFPCLCAIAAWWVPELIINLRKKMVKYEATEDVMQLQTMLIVLSATDMDVMKALYWLERQASVHREALRYCFYEMPQDPELALNRLKECSVLAEFRKIVNKLREATWSLSLEEAFSDMSLDKTQFMYMRDVRQAEEVESRKNSAKLFAIVPGGMALIFLFVAPILILGVTQLMSALQNLPG